MEDLRQIPALHPTRLVYHGGQVYIAGQFLNIYDYDPHVGMIVRVTGWSGDDKYYEIAGPARRPDGGAIAGEYGGWWLIRIDPAEHFAKVKLIADEDRTPPRPAFEDGET